MNTQFCELTVQDIMEPHPVLLDEETPLDEVFRIYLEHNLQCIPVVDKDQRLQGTITTADLERSRQLYDLRDYIAIIFSGMEAGLREQVADNFHLDGPIHLKAREVMSVKLPRVKSTDDLQLLCQRLLEFKSQFAIVVDDNDHIDGIVSTFDILRSLKQVG